MYLLVFTYRPNPTGEHKTLVTYWFNLKDAEAEAKELKDFAISINATIFALKIYKIESEIGFADMI